MTKTWTSTKKQTIKKDILELKKMRIQKRASKMTQSHRRISDLEDNIFEINQSEKQQDKRREKEWKMPTWLMGHNKK